VRIREDETEGDPEFAMAPLLDVVLQLTIFFLVASSWSNGEQRLDLDLPAAGTSSDAPRERPEIVVEVRRDGRTYVSGIEVRREDLASALRGAAGADGTRPVTVRGDRLASHESIVAVLDACEAAGLSDLAVGTIEAPDRLLDGR
jgi:biopolymer transport protein ExbD